MARKPRIHYEGALYHVIARGNNRAYIFEEEKGKKEYLEIIETYKNKYDFILYAYCIMDNHVHILIEVKENPLSRIMQGIQQVYTQRYNKKKNRTGHVFEQRYRAILCDKEEYLLQLIKYIHQNPLRAGFEEGINYKWSSHNEYIGTKDIVDVEYPLSIFSSKKQQSKDMYLKYVMDNEEAEEIDWEIQIDEEILVQRKFKENINKTNIDPEKLINKVLELFDMEFTKVYGNSKNRQVSDIRKALVKLLYIHTNLNNKEIANELGIGQSTVTNILNGRYKNEEHINEFIEKINSQIEL